MLATTLLASETACAERFVDYLHIEASSGASGGGHTAVRFADKTYHYVYSQPGLIASMVEANEHFDFVYRGLQNRSIHLSRIRTTDAEYDALEQAFARRHVTQEAQLERLDAATADAALIAYLRSQRCPGESDSSALAAPRLRGTGYFHDGAVVEGDPTIMGVRAAIDAEYGADYLARKASEVERQILRLTYVAAPSVPMAENRMPAPTGGLAARYTTLATARAALDVLLNAHVPIPDAYRTLADSTDRLSDAELVLLRERAETLRASLVRLIASRREDWGYPMLVGLARAVAIDASLRTGLLVVPDALDAAWIPIADLLNDRPVLDALLRERRTDLDQARAALLHASASSEAAWSRLEVAASAALDLEAAARRGTGVVRAYGETMLPSRAAESSVNVPLPAADCGTLASWQFAADDTEAKLRDELVRLYRYDLLTRNCVTELFRTMASTGDGFAPPAPGGADLDFIPFVSAAVVAKRHPLATRSTLPSYRAYWLERLRKTDGLLATDLRESNTLTATLHHPDKRDDLFLFYTDDVVAARPLYGVVNTGIGIGASVAGLVASPFDSGNLLRRGLRSVVFSAPEIAFVNFRKGRNGMLPKAWAAATTPAPL